MRKRTILMAAVFVMTMTTLAPAATIRWLGSSTPVAQVDSATVDGTIEAGDVFTLTVTGLNGTTAAISISAADTTISLTVADIVSAWNASTNSLATPITAADDDPDVTLTADIAGDAFTVAATTTEAGGGASDAQTFVLANTTASSGPKHWDTAANWSTGAVPDGAHDVYVEDFSGDILYGLDQSGITPLTTLNIGKSFTGKIGSNGSAGIAADYLEILSAIVNIGNHRGPGSPTGSGRIKLDMGATATTINVNATGTAADTGKPSLRLKMASTSSNLYVNKGSVGLAYEAGEISSVGVVRVESITNVAADADMVLGEGVTFGGTNSLTITGGETTLQTAVTTITQSAGSLDIFGSGATTTFKVTGGICNTQSSGNITTLNVEGGVFAATSTGTIGTATITDGDTTLTDTGNITTITASGGTLEVNGTATIGTLTASGTNITCNSTGTITTLTITGGTVDFTGSTAARTVDTPKLDAGGRLKYDPGIITMNNKIDSDNVVTLTATD